VVIVVVDGGPSITSILGYHKRQLSVPNEGKSSSSSSSGGIVWIEAVLFFFLLLLGLANGDVVIMMVQNPFYFNIRMFMILRGDILCTKMMKPR